MNSFRAVRVRPRGPKVKLLRFALFVIWLLCLSGLMRGPTSPAGFAVATLVVIMFTIVLSRWVVLISGQGVAIRSFAHTRSFAPDAVERFEIQERRAPLDQLEREQRLVLILASNEAVDIPWVAWGDMISPWLGDAKRPLRTGQARLLNQLNGAIELINSPTEGGR